MDLTRYEIIELERQRRFGEANVAIVNAWRWLYQDHKNKAADTAIRRYLEYCKKYDLHPAFDVTPDHLLAWSADMHCSVVPAFFSHVRVFLRDAYGVFPFGPGGGGAKSQGGGGQKDVSGHGVLAAHSKAVIKYRKLEEPSLVLMVDMQVVLEKIDAGVVALGGWGCLNPVQMRQLGSPVLMLSAGLRLSDLACMPYMKFRTVPPRVKRYALADQIFALLNRPKECKLRNTSILWSVEILVSQCPGKGLPGRNSFGVVLDAWQSLIKVQASFDVEDEEFLLDGRAVHLQYLIMRLTTDGKRMIVERRPVQKKISSDVISNAIKKLFQRAELPDYWKPRMLRHYFATIMQNGMVARGRWSLQQLVDILRHKGAETTKKSYIAASLHPDTAARWEAAGALLMKLNPWALMWH